LESGRHRYSSIKKIAVIKQKGSNKKVVSLSCFHDVVIQKAFFFLLRKIYEGVFVWQSVDFDTFKTYENYESFRGFIHKRFLRNKGVYEIKKWLIHPIFSPNFFGPSLSNSVHAALERIKLSWGEVT
jgi:hypothetical protein